MGSKQWVRSLRMKKRSADDPDGEIQYRELRTLSQVWADFDTESLALQESDPVAAKKEGWSGRTQRFFNIQWHLLMHLRYGRGHGSDSRYLPKPLNYRLDKRASSCNWQQDLDRRLGLLNLATAPHFGALRKIREANVDDSPQEAPICVCMCTCVCVGICGSRHAH